MIAVDTSALLAVALGEAQAPACRAALETETSVVMSAGTLVEALVVAMLRNVDDEVNRIIEGLGVEVVPVTAAAARRAGAAYRRWGKGRHPAALNFGDCFAYEVAESQGCPLLFVGNDFAKTDVRSVL